MVVINEQLRNKGKETGETADVIKSAGENAIVVVTSSLVKAREQMETNSPALKRAILKNGKQVIIVVDKSLKNPVVITVCIDLLKSVLFGGSFCIRAFANSPDLKVFLSPKE